MTGIECGCFPCHHPLPQSGGDHPDHGQRMQHIEGGDPLLLAARQAWPRQEMLAKDCPRQPKDENKGKTAGQDFAVHHRQHSRWTNQPPATLCCVSIVRSVGSTVAVRRLRWVESPLRTWRCSAERVMIEFLQDARPMESGDVAVTESRSDSSSIHKILGRADAQLEPAREFRVVQKDVLVCSRLPNSLPYRFGQCRQLNWRGSAKIGICLSRN